MKTITSSNKSVAVILHCEVRLETQEATNSPEESRATESKPGEAPVTQLDTSSPSFANFAETWIDDNVVRWRLSGFFERNWPHSSQESLKARKQKARTSGLSRDSTAGLPSLCLYCRLYGGERGIRTLDRDQPIHP